MAYLDILSEDKFIPYRKELNKLTGSVTATILLSQIIRRWKQHDCKPFYKFRAPCGHRLYKKGDSWTEELGFTERELDTALAILCKKEGKVRKDIKEDAAKKKEECIGYVIAHTNIERVTYYTLNTKLLEKDLTLIYGGLGNPQNVDYESNEMGITIPTNEGLDIYKETESTTNTTTEYDKQPTPPTFPLKDKTPKTTPPVALAPPSFSSIKTELWGKTEIGSRLPQYLQNMGIYPSHPLGEKIFAVIFDKWFAHIQKEKGEMAMCDGTEESICKMIQTQFSQKVSIYSVLHKWTTSSYSKADAQNFLKEHEEKAIPHNEIPDPTKPTFF